MQVEDAESRQSKAENLKELMRGNLEKAALLQGNVAAAFKRHAHLLALAAAGEAVEEHEWDAQESEVAKLAGQVRRLCAILELQRRVLAVLEQPGDSAVKAAKPERLRLIVGDENYE